MSGYSIGVGQPPMNCNICGSRVPRVRCERHPREPGYIALRDKYVGIFVLRNPAHHNDDPCKAHLVFREPLSREHHAEIARRVVDPGAPQPVNVPAARRSPSHCQICGLTDAEYAHTAKICSDPWHTVPSDYVLMPREATHAMTMAGCDSLPSCEHVFGHAGEMLKNAYQKMVAVAAENVPREEGGAGPVAWKEAVEEFIDALGPCSQLFEVNGNVEAVWVVEGQKFFTLNFTAALEHLRPLYTRPPHGWQDVGTALHPFAYYFDLNDCDDRPDDDATRQSQEEGR